MNVNKQKIGIIILVHNAAQYVQKCIESIKKHTQNIEHYLVVVDNNSDMATKQLLSHYYLTNTINILCSLESNRFFSKANNIGAKILPEDCTHILLLNSDVEVLSDSWLSNMLTLHEKGITTYGAVIEEPKAPNRGDGYCFLIDKNLYYNFWLDESFPWFWSITKLQALVLNSGHKVKAVKDHQDFIKHYGGKSGDALKKVPSATYIDSSTVKSWFNNKKTEIL